MLSALGRLAKRWTESVDPWTDVYGLARSILALGTASTLAFNHPETLFRPALGLPAAPLCEGPSVIGLFCLCSGPHLDLGRWLAVAILLGVASGWRPRLTGLLHWWVSYSLQTSAVVIDGGDQVTGVLTLLLLPVTLTDGRRWHWERPRGGAPRGREVLARLVALSALTMVRLQVAGIYFHSSVAKMHVEEWADGTALYYWFTDPTFGAPPWLRPLLAPVLTHGASVALVTWGAILLELVLFMALVMPKWAWAPLLVAGVAFHAGIAVVHGLISFSLAMTAALVLYLRPVERDFGFVGLREWWRAATQGKPSRESLERVVPW